MSDRVPILLALRELLAGRPRALPLGMGERPKDGYRPASPRTGVDDSKIVDVSSLPLYGAGVAPLELPKLGLQTGVVIVNGEFGGSLLTLNPTAPRPFAAIVGRPIYRLIDTGIWGWKTSKAWGQLVLEYYAWDPEQEPNDQLEQILRWSQGYAQPTVDVTASVDQPTATNVILETGNKGDHGQVALSGTNQFSTIRLSATASGSGTVILNTTDPVVSGVTLSDGESYGPWYGPLAYHFDDDACTLEVVEALA